MKDPTYLVNRCLLLKHRYVNIESQFFDLSTFEQPEVGKLETISEDGVMRSQEWTTKFPTGHFSPVSRQLIRANPLKAMKIADDEFQREAVEGLVETRAKIWGWNAQVRTYHQVDAKQILAIAIPSYI